MYREVGIRDGPIHRSGTSISGFWSSEEGEAEGDDPVFWSNLSIGGEAAPGDGPDLAAEEGHADNVG